LRRAATVRSAWPAQNLRLPPGQIQTVIFLKLLVAGHLTIYITRSEWWFWKRPWPSARLFWTTEATQALGTLAAVYGWFLEPIGWGDALLVWAYALAWFPFNNAVRVWVLDLQPSEGKKRRLPGAGSGKKPGA